MQPNRCGISRGWHSVCKQMGMDQEMWLEARDGQASRGVLGSGLRVQASVMAPRLRQERCAGAGLAYVACGLALTGACLVQPAYSQVAPPAAPSRAAPTASAASSALLGKALREAEGPRRRILEAAQQAQRARVAGAPAAPPPPSAAARAAQGAAAAVKEGRAEAVAVPPNAAPAASAAALAAVAPASAAAMQAASASTLGAPASAMGAGFPTPAARQLPANPVAEPPLGQVSAATPLATRGALPLAGSAAPLVAPAAGSAAADIAAAEQRYTAGLAAQVDRLRRYPAHREARLLRPEGTVRLAITVDRGGQVLGVDLLASSGSLLLDQEALRNLKQARFEPMPAQAFPSHATRRFDVSLDFRLDPR